MCPRCSLDWIVAAAVVASVGDAADFVYSSSKLSAFFLMALVAASMSTMGGANEVEEEAAAPPLFDGRASKMTAAYNIAVVSLIDSMEESVGLHPNSKNCAAK